MPRDLPSLDPDPVTWPMMASRDAEYIIVRMLVGDQFKERGMPRWQPRFWLLEPPSQGTKGRHDGLGDGDVGVDIGDDVYSEH